MIHLDTGFLVRALTAGTPQDRRLRAWLAAGEPLGMSAVAWTEFLCGPVEPEGVELVGRVVHDRVPFGEGEAALACAALQRVGPAAGITRRLHDRRHGDPRRGCARHGEPG